MKNTNSLHSNFSNNDLENFLGTLSLEQLRTVNNMAHKKIQTLRNVELQEIKGMLKVGDIVELRDSNTRLGNSKLKIVKIAKKYATITTEGSHIQYRVHMSMLVHPKMKFDLV